MRHFRPDPADPDSLLLAWPGFADDDVVQRWAETGFADRIKEAVHLETEGLITQRHEP